MFGICVIFDNWGQVSYCHQGWDKYRKKIASTHINTAISQSANTDTNTDYF